MRFLPPWRAVAGLLALLAGVAGAPARADVICHYTYGGETRTLDDILAEVAGHGLRHVCVTGGEPLAQKGCLALLAALCDAGHDVSLETSGALDIAGVDPRVSRIMDLKAPDSGEVGRNLWSNLDCLDGRDEIKIVIASRGDYEWARDVVRQRQIDAICPVLFSPAQGLLEARSLADWILEDGLNVRFQLQLHKLLWGNMQGK